MKKRYLFMIVMVVLMASLVLAALAVAADFNPGQIGAGCEPGETGTWHFVNNQTGGAGPGSLTAVFADSDDPIIVGPTSTNRNNQHFFIFGPAGPLLSASTNLPGRLVLSDLDCTGGKPPPK